MHDFYRFEYKKLTQGKPSKMTEERILMLEAEGFTWSVSERLLKMRSWLYFIPKLYTNTSTYLFGF